MKYKSQLYPFHTFFLKLNSLKKNSCNFISKIKFLISEYSLYFREIFKVMFYEPGRKNQLFQGRASRI